MHSHLDSGHPALAEAVKKLEQLKPDQFELYFERHTRTSVESKDQKVETLERAEDLGLAVRLIQDKKLGFSYTTSLEPAAIHRAIETARDVAAHMPTDEFAGFRSFGSSAYPSFDQFDTKGAQAPMSSRIELARELEAKTRASDPRIQGIRAARVSEHQIQTQLVDSNGSLIQHRATLYTASVSCKAEKDGEAQMGGDMGYSNFFDQLHADIPRVARQAATYATELLGAGQAPTMKCPAILRNGVVADLIEFLSGSFSAEQIDKGRSMLAGKQGERVFSDLVTLVDDGLMAGGYATGPFDGEGTPSSKTTLIDRGFFSNALYDSYHARKHGKQPTGHATRGIKSPPSIGTTNLYLQAGKKDEEALRAGISRGILITDLMGVHTANPVTGDFSLGASGILIEDGRLTRPVRGFAVAGNVLDLFRKITELGSDIRFFGSVGAPSARISEISVGGV